MKADIRHILLVDDDQDDIYFFATALEDVDPEVRLSTACEGADALAKLQHIKPDLILVDLVMPGVNGVNLIRMLKSDKRLNGIPVIVYTTDLSIFQEEEVLALGAEQVIIKANDFVGTVETISRLLKLPDLRQSA